MIEKIDRRYRIHLLVKLSVNKIDPVPRPLFQNRGNVRACAARSERERKVHPDRQGWCGHSAAVKVAHERKQEKK